MSYYGRMMIDYRRRGRNIIQEDEAVAKLQRKESRIPPGPITVRGPLYIVCPDWHPKRLPAFIVSPA